MLALLRCNASMKESSTMIFRIALLILCLPSLLLMGSNANQGAQYAEGPVPAWVKPQSFPVEAVPLKPTQVNFQYLLIDTQRHWEAKTLYSHFAAKALTQEGVEDLSKIDIDFCPSFSRVIVHGIRVFR